MCITTSTTMAAVARMPMIHRADTPLSDTIPNTTTAMTITVPTSGCARIRKTGGTASPSVHQTSRPSGATAPAGRARAVTSFAEHHAREHDQRDLRELRRLHLEAGRQVDPRVRTID